HHRRFMWCRFAYVLAVTLFGAFAQTPCEQLKMLKLTRMAITQAESKAAGPLQSSGNPATATAQMLPSYCRVAATLTPTSDSDIKMEVWLPASVVSNGKFEAVGGGGWAGVISYSAMATALQDGYATSSTDTGHEARNADFAAGHPEKVIDF